jgi:hypothetical protein
MLPNLLLLMCEDPTIRSSKRAAQQHETGRLVLGKEPERLGLVHAPFEELACAGRAPALQARVRQLQPGLYCGVEQVLLLAYIDR